MQGYFIIGTFQRRGILVVTFLKFGRFCSKVKDWDTQSTYSETHYNMRSAKLEILTALLMKIQNFRYVTPCLLLICMALKKEGIPFLETS